MARAYEEPDIVNRRYIADVVRLRQELDQLKRDMYGSPEYGIEGVIPTQKHNIRSLELIHRILVGLSIVTSLLFAIVTVAWVQQWF